MLEEVLRAYESNKTYQKSRVSNMQKDHLLFLNECLRFMVFSFVLFSDEESVSGFFNRVKSMTGGKKSQQTNETGQFEQLLTALVYFMGCHILRENSSLLLYICVYQQMWICTKVSKT